MSDYANTIRPNKIEDIVGQEHLKPLLQKMVDKKEMFSLILYGEPGIGKTSISYALCDELKLSYSYFNAATGNKKELQEHIKISDVLIIDEIHRLNKDKQDILLPALERSAIKVIMTTTENPFFSVVPALRSRTRLFELKPLTKKDIYNGLKHVIKKENISIDISDELLTSLADNCNGDYRYAINTLDMICKLYPKKKVDKNILKQVIPTIHFYSDKSGDGHYDLLSAFHKSLRGSDVDASLYYFGRLIESNDIIGMERRMIGVCYEDIGLANPNIGMRVMAAIDAAKKVGFPQAKLPLSVAVIEIAKAEKSNSAMLAINDAITTLNENGVYPIPDHLKDAHYNSAKKLNRGVGYKYPHDYGGHVEQQYLPDDIKDLKFYKKNKNDKL